METAKRPRNQINVHRVVWAVVRWPLGTCGGMLTWKPADTGASRFFRVPRIPTKQRFPAVGLWKSSSKVYNEPMSMSTLFIRSMITLTRYCSVLQRIWEGS